MKTVVAAFKRLGAGASLTGWLAPLAASIAAVALLRVEAKNITLVDLTRPEQLLLLSVLIGIGVWLIALLLYLPLTGPKRANFRSYSLLRNRIEGLRARCEIVCRGAQKEAELICARVRKSLDVVDDCLRSGSGIGSTAGGISPPGKRFTEPKSSSWMSRTRTPSWRMRNMTFSA